MKNLSLASKCFLNLLACSAKHGLLDVCVHPPESVVSSGDALEVAKRPVLVTHHLLHHGRVPRQLHCLNKDKNDSFQYL